MTIERARDLTAVAIGGCIAAALVLAVVHSALGSSGVARVAYVIGLVFWCVGLAICLPSWAVLAVVANRRERRPVDQ